MTTELKLRGGTTAEHATFAGAAREATVDTDKNTLIVHDGTTAGGHPLAPESASTAQGTSYDGTDSGLASTNVKDAIDEVAAQEPEIASTAQAEAGTDNETFITPLRMREGFNAGGDAPVFACRAWVNFDGTGTVSIRASGNVSSITDNGTGDYTVNFNTAMPDANYSATFGTGTDRTSQSGGTNTRQAEPVFELSSTTAFRFYIGLQSSPFEFRDAQFSCVAIFR